jgi:hypothetical protein
MPQTSGLRRRAVLLLAVLSLAPGLAPAQASGAADADALTIGRRIYREGILPSGQPLRGLGPAGVVLSGKAAACETCHRRSGYGSSEGPVEVRSITGPALFGDRVAPAAPGSAIAPVAAPGGSGLSAAELAQARADALRAARANMFAGTRPRPTYEDGSLARAIREGVDVTGRPMHVSMPRYGIEPDALAALTAYLRTLSAHTSPGVTDEQVHFATVIQPGTDPARRRALLDVLETYIKNRNLGLSDQVMRERGGNRRLGRVYREWVLHVWDLTGPSETWGRQLDAFYEAQPVFAMVSGMGSASWRPIHEFSERVEVPCIFPQVDLPVLSDHDFYTVYLSRGITLEAQALARFIRAQADRGPMTQVYRRDQASAATGADAFREAWQASGDAAVEEVALDDTPDEAFWQQLAQRKAGESLVLWLSPGDLAHAQSLASAGSPVRAVYLSASLNAGPRTGLAAGSEGRVRMVYPQDVPAARDGRLEVVRRWLHDNGVAPGDEKVQMNAYLAATETGMLVTHSRDTFSREFLIERMEHRLGTALELSIYPHLSLGPGQRYASKGSYIVAVKGADDRQLEPLSDWIVP